MSIDFTAPELTELQPNIIVMGVGGAGGNAVNNMIDAQLQGVSFVVANTDAQALAHSKCSARIQLGKGTTQGLGAGSQPARGQAAADESLETVEEHLRGAHMLFITAGMGGGTGTGAAPVIAQKAREMGILTVGVVTKPFTFEGARRMRAAEAGIEALQAGVDTLIIIPNQNLFRVATEKTTFADAFAIADDVLHSGVRGITDLMVMPGLINLDFADVQTVMTEMGKAMMGTGEAEGDNRAQSAAEAAISNPLLDEVSLRGAKGVIVNITGGMDLTLYEVDEAANHIREQVEGDANIIVGSAFNEALNGQMRVSVVATGIETQEQDIQAPGRGASVVELRRSGRTPAAVGTSEGHSPAARATATAMKIPEPELQAETTPEPETYLEAEPESIMATAPDCLNAQTVEDKVPNEQPTIQPVEPRPVQEVVKDTEAGQQPLALDLTDAFVPAAPRPTRQGIADRLTDLGGSQVDAGEVAHQAEDRPCPAGQDEMNPIMSEKSKGAEKSRSLFKKLQDTIAMAGQRHETLVQNNDSVQPHYLPIRPHSMEMGGLDPSERPAPSDDLKIPSFLRAQKN